MTRRKPPLGLLALLASSLVLSTPAAAQVMQSGYTLPLKLATQAATEAVRFCEAGGYNVTATVVDASGAIKLLATGDHSTIHSSFRKAYTIVTMGPIFKVGTTSRFADLGLR